MTSRGGMGTTIYGEVRPTEAVNKTAYMLDNAEQASQFEGKKVKVTGFVDAASNTIHIESIKEIPSGNASQPSYA